MCQLITLKLFAKPSLGRTVKGCVYGKVTF